MGALSHLLPGSDFVRAIVFIDDDLDPRALGRQLARFDVVINGMADADANGRVLEWIAPHLAASPVPVLNPPDDVLANTRDRVYRQLDAIDDVVVPRTDRVLLEPPLARSLKDYVAANGFDLPILYRPAGSHAGRGLVRIAAPSDWPRLDAAFGTEAKAGPGYVSSFVDYADDDGIFAKFRLFCVGDDIVASHYLTARDWNVHWKNARAAMARDPALRRREVDFLDRFDDVTRPALEPRLRRIRDAVGLDFFGIDGALTRSGALLVFEANASMMISDRNRERDYPHLARPIARIKASFLDLVRARLAESGRAPPKETKGP
jgi:glutathione synthase/RimK-type ligase-like ATP-grasp enzyme